MDGSFFERTGKKVGRSFAARREGGRNEVSDRKRDYLVWWREASLTRVHLAEEARCSYVLVKTDFN